MKIIEKITTNLWFDNNAEEAVDFYKSVFSNSSTIRTSRYGKEGHEIHKMPDGAVMTIEFELEGRTFVALNGGPVFRFNEAVSFIINCASQEEVDYYWNSLSEGGDEQSQQCGWLKDKFGVSWQVVPAALADMMTDADHNKRDRVMKVMLQMKKLDLRKLEEAYGEEEAVVV